MKDESEVALFVLLLINALMADVNKCQRDLNLMSLEGVENVQSLIFGIVC